MGRVGGIPSPRTRPVTLIALHARARGCTVEVNFTLGFLPLQPFRTCPGHPCPPLPLALRHRGPPAGGSQPRSQALGAGEGARATPERTEWTLCAGAGVPPAGRVGTALRGIRRHREAPRDSVSGRGTGARGPSLPPCVPSGRASPSRALVRRRNPGAGLVPLLPPGPGGLLAPEFSPFPPFLVGMSGVFPPAASLGGRRVGAVGPGAVQVERVSRTRSLLQAFVDLLWKLRDVK